MANSGSKGRTTTFTSRQRKKAADQIIGAFRKGRIDTGLDGLTRRLARQTRGRLKRYKLSLKDLATLYEQELDVMMSKGLIFEREGVLFCTKSVTSRPASRRKRRKARVVRSLQPSRTPLSP